MNTEIGILQNKLDRAFTYGAANGGQFLNNLLQQGQAMDDYLVPSRKMTYLVGGLPDVEVGPLELHIMNGDGVTSGVLHDHALGQLSGRLDIPGKYIKELAHGEAWQRHLATRILEEHTENTAERNFLVRKVGDEFRGILSDKYRRLNNLPIFTTFAKRAMASGAKLYDGHLGDLTAFLEVAYPEIITVETEKNGVVHAAIGAQISSSDFGARSLEVRTFLLQVSCLNGATFKNVKRAVHLGSRLEEANFAFSPETYTKDTEAMQSAMGDIAGALFTPELREHMVASIHAASNAETTLEAEVKALPKLGVRQAEIEMLQEVLAASNPEHGVQGDITKWKVVQALTHVANKQDATRKRELQEVGGSMLEGIHLN